MFAQPMRRLLAAAAPLLLAAAAQAQEAAPLFPTLHGAPTLVIGHRGSPGYRPDHTLGGYELAIDVGADCIEPDLVMSKDGQLVARHEPEIGGTTNVAEVFPDRKTKKDVDGTATEGWFTDDFTLAELKQLHAKQPRPDRPNAWDAAFEIPTFQEVIDLAKRKSLETGRLVCIYPETKHPTYFADKGLDIDKALVEALDRNGYTTPQAPVFVQSFEVGNLKKLAGMTKVRLVQLFDEYGAKPYDFVRSGDARTYKDLMAPAELKTIATYAYGIGPWKRTIIEDDGKNNLLPANNLITDAHAAGLVVHAYTFRDEPKHLASDYNNRAELEYVQFFKLGLDGLFSDHPETAVRARQHYVAR